MLLSLGVGATKTEKGWLPRLNLSGDVGGQLVYKQEGTLRFTFYECVELSERSRLIDSTRSYLKACLSLLHETELNDTIDIILVRNRDDMQRIVGLPFSGFTSTEPQEGYTWKTLVCIGGPKNPLKHEVMHLVSRSKWGSPKDEAQMVWLEEGLATYADPEAECDTLSFEAKYRYFLQTGRALNADELIDHFVEQTSKISYNQSAYLVGYLLEKEGIETLKRLWMGGMDAFETVYGITFSALLHERERSLMSSNQPPRSLDWNEFIRPCY